MTKDQIPFYEDEVRIFDHDRYNELGDMDTLHIFYRYDSINEVGAGERMDLALQNRVIDEIFEAMDNLRALDCVAPPTAEIHAIDAGGIYNIGTILINEDTYYFINEWEDASENYSDI